MATATKPKPRKRAKAKPKVRPIIAPRGGYVAYSFKGEAATNREQWLQRAAELLSAEFTEILQAHGNGLSELSAPPVRISCAFPVGTRGGSGAHAIGQCWHGSVSGDGTFEIFITPEYGADQASRVVDILLHEMIHAIDKLESGHKARFKEIAVACGLEGPMTATKAGEDLSYFLSFLEARIGPYPHAAMAIYGGGRGSDPRTPGKGQPPIITDAPPKQSTRLLKAECDSCGCIIRLSKSAAARAGGLPLCHCGGKFEGEGFDD